MQKGNVKLYICGNIHVTFLLDVSPLMQPSGHKMSTAIDLHQVVTSAIILLSCNTFTIYVTLAPHRKATFFVIVDAHSKWMEAADVSSPSSIAQQAKRVLRHAFATHRLPDILVHSL